MMIQTPLLESTYYDIKRYDQDILEVNQANEISYCPALFKIRQELEHCVERFPHLKCGIASCVVESLLGLSVGEVAYRPHHPNHPIRYDGEGYFGFQRMHFCNIDFERGVYVDLSQDQYVPELPSVVIMPYPNNILVMVRTVNSEHLLKFLSEQEIAEMNTIVANLKSSFDP